MSDKQVYAIAIYEEDGRMSVGIRRDGSVEYGPAFTTESAAAKRFWDAMGDGLKTWLQS